MIVFEQRDTDNGQKWLITAHRSYRQQENEKQLILNMLEKRLEAWNRRDTDGVLADIAEDVRYESSNGKITVGKQALKEQYQKLFDGPLNSTVSKQVVDDFQFISDDVVVVEAHWETSSQSGEPIGKGKSIVILRRTTGTAWEIASLHVAKNTDK